MAGVTMPAIFFVVFSIIDYYLLHRQTDININWIKKLALNLPLINPENKTGHLLGIPLLVVKIIFTLI